MALSWYLKWRKIKKTVYEWYAWCVYWACNKSKMCDNILNFIHKILVGSMPANTMQRELEWNRISFWHVWLANNNLGFPRGDSYVVYAIGIFNDYTYLSYILVIRSSNTIFTTLWQNDVHVSVTKLMLDTDIYYYMYSDCRHKMK